MTTQAAAQLYLSGHLGIWGTKGFAVYNPHAKPVDELPVIYGFNNGGPHEFYHGVLIAQDGVILGEHVCSHEGYMPHDLGILHGSRPDRHKIFRVHFPDGYRMEFVGYEDTKTNQGLGAALKAFEARRDVSNRGQS